MFHPTIQKVEAVSIFIENSKYVTNFQICIPRGFLRGNNLKNEFCLSDVQYLKALEHPESAGKLAFFVSFTDSIAETEKYSCNIPKK